MGLDLSLLPFYLGKSNCSFVVLDVGENDEVFDRIRNVKQQVVDEGFASYLSVNGDYAQRHYGDTMETPYGEPLTWCRAGDLKKCGISGPTGAYLEALEDDHRVALYWC